MSTSKQHIISHFHGDQKGLQLGVAKSGQKCKNGNHPRPAKEGPKTWIYIRPGTRLGEEIHPSDGADDFPLKEKLL